MKKYHNKHPREIHKHKIRLAAWPRLDNKRGEQKYGLIAEWMERWDRYMGLINSHNDDAIVKMVKDRMRTNNTTNTLFISNPDKY
jgi:hypothetical protein